jgi:hypothetical protein
VRVLKLILRASGVFINIGLAGVGIWHLCVHRFSNYLTFCKWVSDTFVLFALGGLGCILEYKGYASELEGWRAFALNRSTTSLFYLAIGFYYMGQVLSKHTLEGMVPTLWAIGILAWVVAVGDAVLPCVACCAREKGETSYQDINNTPGEHRAGCCV